MEQSEQQYQDEYLILEEAFITSTPSLDPSTIYQAASTPEERIWAAVLVAAISDLGRKGEREAALEWICTAGDEIGSFDFCCELFKLSPEAIRQHLLTDYEPRYLATQKCRG